jgi:hypothetical protein
MESIQSTSHKGFLSVNFFNVPADLKNLDRWVCWSLTSDGKKIPYDPKTINSRASSTDSTTWSTFTEAETAYQERVGEYDAYDGIGFVLNGDGIVGVDLDQCVSNGTPRQEALALLDEIGANYVEISPSGTGLRAFGYADNLEKGRIGKLNELKVELYTNSRYLTFTGHPLKNKPLSYLHGFKRVSDLIISERNQKADQITGLITDASNADERHARFVREILSGEIYHNHLRDLAASLIATGMGTGAAINHLRALMDACTAPHDKRWEDRRAQIPNLVNSASKKYRTEKYDKKIEEISASGTPYFKLLTAEELAALPRLRWLVKGILPAEGLAALYGPSGSGKSFLALDLFAAVAEGTPWFNLRVELSFVVYVALEGESGFQARIQAWEKSHQRTLPNTMRFVLQKFRLTSPNDVTQLANEIFRIGGKGSVVVLDTLNRAAPTSDENSSKDMGEILEGAKTLQQLIGGLVVLVHHTGKDATRGMRGHSSMLAALDGAIEVNRNSDERTWKVSKSKDGRDGDTNTFELEEVDLDQDEHGDLISSCVVTPIESSSISRKKGLTLRQRDGVQSLFRASSEHGYEREERIHVHIEAWRIEFYRTCTADNQSAKKVAFLRVRNDLVKLGKICVQDDVYSMRVNDTDLIGARLLAIHPPKMSSTKDAEQTET